MATVQMSDEMAAIAASTGLSFAWFAPKATTPSKPHARNFARILALQDGKCSICSKPVDLNAYRFDPTHPLARSWDHVKPRSAGGGRTKNCLVAHRSCNTARSSKPATPEMLALLERVYG